MFTDNGPTIKEKIRPGCEAEFIRLQHKEEPIWVYWAVNRAARRYLESNAFRNYAKKNNLIIDYKTYSVK